MMDDIRDVAFDPVKDGVTQVLKGLSVDVKREGLLETPQRYAKAMRFLTKGYDELPEDVIKVFSDGGENYDEMVYVGDIRFYSLCEHHMLPFFGEAHVSYIPNGRILGLSKIPRLVEVFARRFTVQERLTTQIANTLESLIKPIAVGVVIRARHMCVEMRGVQKPNTVTTTSALRGRFKMSAAARSEFMNMIDFTKAV